MKSWLVEWRRPVAVAALAGAAGALLGGGALAQDDSTPEHQVTPGALSDDVKAAGQAVYKAHCAACHDSGVGRAPAANMLGNLSPDAVLRTITIGQMKDQAASLTDAEKAAVAQFVTGHKLGDVAATKPLMCPANANWFDRKQPPVLKGWGFDAGSTHSIPAAVAGLPRANIGKLRLKWALAFPNVLSARSQPAIAGGALFVGGSDSTVYALDPATGCARWTFATGGAIRMGIVVDNWTAGDARAHPRVYFGDLLGNAYALDAATGKLVWRRKLDDHPNATLTGTPALSGNTLYFPISSFEEPAAAVAGHSCCTFRGSLVAVDSATGEQRWRTWMVDPAKPTTRNTDGVQGYGPSGVAIWSTPVVDAKRGQVYVATGDNYSPPATKLSDAILALDLKTGTIKWSYQASPDDIWNAACMGTKGANCPKDDGPDHDFGSGPILAKGKDGRDYLLAGQKSGVVYAVDPATGKLHWSQRVGRGGVFGGIHFGIAAANGAVFAPVTDFPDGNEHDIPPAPGVYALDIATGKRLWSAPAPRICNGKQYCEPGYAAAISVAGNFVLAGSTDAHMRIFDAATGKTLWDLDTDMPYKSVNGAMGHGGSMAGGGAPIAWHGMLFVNSGYGFLSKIPGNMLLAFEADGK